MNKWVRLGTLSVIALGCFVVVNDHPQRVHADEQYYVDPDQNSASNIQQLQASNGMSSYAKSSITTVASVPPTVVYNGKFSHTDYQMDQQNPSHSYQDQQGTNTFNTYYYLPNGFHADYREYGNYQSSVKVNDNMYYVESLGDNVKQGVIAKYNLTDLTNLGVLGGNGDGRDLIWKAYTYTSPYTTEGQANIKAAANYQSLLTDAGYSDQDSQNAVTNANAQVVSDQQLAAEYQKQLTTATKVADQFASKVQATLAKQRQYDQRVAKKLTASNYVAYFNTVNQQGTKAANQIEVKQKRLKQQLHTAKGKQRVKLTARLKKLGQQGQQLGARLKAATAALKQFNAGVGQSYQTALQNVSDAQDLVNGDLDAVTTAKQNVTNNVQILEAQHAEYEKYAAIVAAAQVTPMLNIGHGQTLSYNPVTKNLYLVQDDDLGNLPAGGENTITELDPTTLQPIKQFNFPLIHGNNNYSINTLTFDSAGNAYFGRKESVVESGQKSYSTYQIYKGTLDETTGAANFAPVPQSINWGGYSNQNLAYDAFNNRMYIISDNIITSVPLDKLNAGTLQPSDVNYMSFDINREFEDLTFDDQGYGYLLTLWDPEVMKSENPMN
ncbi:hypothetical protein [Lactobacillus sp. Sy-1]|uniref:hypothetical protein n=1 Tax=Lactobacillus sp. Sy-1 TaxID=2109645 RepID=UPI001C55DE72|nr:hypothetical protein [Lactobacillus sp. Sy-1]MBW1605175.1 hypothetical protein [Lactobacillus sp. Sy-1]